MTDLTKFSFLLLSFLLVSLLSSCRETATAPNNKELPEILDPDLKLDLIAEAPTIMTPIGLAIDAMDQIYLLESHTHTPPKDYAGPRFDRIKRGIDRDKDGIPESWEIFADSISDGMNLAAGPDQTVYLACKNMVIAFRDNDRDGRSEQVDTLLEMRAGGDIYDHAGIMGVSIAPDGALFVSRGNTGGLAWEMTAADGSSLSNYGDGGNVVRLSPEGSRLEEVATGFWNPFDLQFTASGRLMLTDNDPDSRGPNRLIDLVYGGDYGYKSLYGGSGIHPFLAWNGELPGTLPYTAALGEAPCGLIDAGFTNFGPEYENHILAAIWEENSIVKIPLGAGDLSSGPTEVLLKGDSTFHPVAFATNSKGELFFTDWVVRQYPNHQKGRLWRLSGQAGQPVVSASSEAASRQLERWFYRSLKVRELPDLQAALKGGTPHTQAVARKLLSRPQYINQVRKWLSGNDEQLILQALLIAFHHTERIDSNILKALLRTGNEAIQRTVLKYIALKSRNDLYQFVQEALPAGNISPALFASYLATIRHLQPAFIEQYQHKVPKQARLVERKLPEGFLLSILQDPGLSPQIRAAVIPELDIQEISSATLVRLLEQEVIPIQMAILQLSTQKPLPDAEALMLAIAREPERNPQLSSLALLSLSYQAGNHCEAVADMLPAAPSDLQEIALRYLCRCQEDTLIQNSVQALLEANEQLHAIWQVCKGVATDRSRPADHTAWQSTIDGRGNAQRGKWVFHSRKAQCQNCHKIDEWGSDFGPDLSHIGSSKSKTQLLTALLEPSAEISPEWQGWYVTDEKGNTHYGRQIDVGYNNAELLLTSGRFVTYDNPRSYGMAPSSLMPDGLEQRLTVPEVNDLITYLLSLK